MSALSYLSPLPPDPVGIRCGSPLPPDPPIAVADESPLPPDSGQELGAGGKARSKGGESAPTR